MSHLTFEGIIPPIPTPFAHGEVAHDQLAQNVQRWAQTGISGILALGSNGEYVYLSEKEKLQVIETVVKAAPDQMPVLAGTGCESTAETIRLTAACAEHGADAALVVTPGYYGGQMRPDTLFRHYQAVADAAPVPILLYNVPKFTHVNLDPDTVGKLSQHPNIIGIKDSTGNVAQLGAILNAVAPDFNVLVGTAGALCGAVALGCPGGVLALANVAPRQCVSIWQQTRQGRLEEARRLQLKMLPVNEAVTGTFGVAGLKYALDRIGYYGGSPRPPLLPVDKSGRDKIDGILAGAGLV